MIQRYLLQLFLIFLIFSPSVLWAADPPFSLPDKDELSRLRSAVIETNKGSLFIELYPDKAPWHVANFKYLADKGYYRGSSFHIFYPGYIIQGGSPSSNPNDGPGWSLPPEFHDEEHVFGALGMARLGDDLNRERRSHGSQFHLLLSDAPHMNGSFTLFGKVTSGLDVLQKLEKGDRIQDVVVYVRPDEGSRKKK